MRLTVYTDYSLRLLIFLAIKAEGLATIGAVARRYGISEHHMTKVAHQLGRAGLVATVRGKGGGLRLARAAPDIGLGEVVRYTEPDMALVPCFGSAEAPARHPCPIVPACGLRNVLHEAREAFMAVLDRYTLADLVRQQTELRRLLLPEDPPAPG